MYKAIRFYDFPSYNAWLAETQTTKRITITNIIAMNTYFIVTYFEEEIVSEPTP
jgi:hypothetical protein